MTLQHSFRLKVAILGGGFSGASLAWQLAERRIPAQITVVEPRAELGRGLAYSSTEPAHRINVPAHRMTMDPDRLEDFLDWLTEAAAGGQPAHDPASLTTAGELFPAREVFGRYVADRLRPHLADGRVRHHRARVSDVATLADGSFELMLSDESHIRADILVLATGHPGAALLPALAGLGQVPQLVADPYDRARLAQIDGDARVLILGAALGAADVIATLDRLGHRGTITCLSRHGLRARGHAPGMLESEEDFTDPPTRSTAELLRRARHAVVDDQARGQGWHATVARLRGQGQQIWAALDQPNRARLLRHLRSFWDVHRYRLAPQVEAVLTQLEADGRLEFLAGRLASAEPEGGAIRLGWTPRGAREVIHADFDVVINTTGPAHARCIQTNPALGALARLGLIAPDPLGLGLATTRTCHAVDASGAASTRVLIAGPLARGHLGELVGAPECASQVAAIAQEIARQALLAPILRPAALAVGTDAHPS